MAPFALALTLAFLRRFLHVLKIFLFLGYAEMEAHVRVELTISVYKTGVIPFN